MAEATLSFQQTTTLEVSAAYRGKGVFTHVQEKKSAPPMRPREILIGFHAALTAPILE